MDPHDSRDLIVPRLAFIAVGAQRSRHSPDAVSVLVLSLDSLDSISESLIFLHSLARVSSTTIKGAPAGMGESARLGNGYPAAMCCRNCFVNDEIFFLSRPHRQDACLSTPAGFPTQCAALGSSVLPT